MQGAYLIFAFIQHKECHTQYLGEPTQCARLCSDFMAQGSGLGISDSPCVKQSVNIAQRWSRKAFPTAYSAEKLREMRFSRSACQLRVHAFVAHKDKPDA